MIRTLVFDFGGVILTMDPDAALRRLQELGLATAADYLNPYTQGGIFGEVEEGKITADEFRQQLGALIGRELTYNDCQYFWFGYRNEVPRRNYDILARLRQEGYRLVLLSNTNDYMMSWALSQDFDPVNHKSLSDYFDALYLSHRLKTMKPSASFFNKLIEGEGIDPHEALFIDDGQRNIAAAQALGFHTLCPVNGEDWTAKLTTLLAELNKQ